MNNKLIVKGTNNKRSMKSEITCAVRMPTSNDRERSY